MAIFYTKYRLDSRVIRYPFVKERVRDERSLEQYLYRRWEQIKNPGGRELVQVLATAGAYGIAVPFEPLLRDSKLRDALFNRLDKDDQRLVDFFCRWQQFGWERRNWALYIRHAALALLLTRMLNPSESDIPFTPLLPILARVAGTEADRWFVEQLVYRLGRRFGSQAPSFSLEVDTAAQRASRAIFREIPQSIYDASRTVCHHHARFHIHLLHACLRAIENPDSTHLPQHVVRPLAQGALEEATLLLERARNVSDDKEKIGNVLNSLAAGISQLARAYGKQGETETAIQYYRDAIDRANEAISHDAANGHALYNLLNTILHKFEENLVSDAREAAELYVICEDRLETLIRLHENRQWRNANEDDADLAVAGLVRRHLNVANQLRSNSRASSFRVTSEVAQVLLEVRALSGLDSLRTVFLDRGRASRLRELRSRVNAVGNGSSRALLLLYKLYLNDPVGRLRFAERLSILGRVERLSPDDYDPYRHDRAALFCLTGSFEAGTSLFEQIYIGREADPERWFWVNERLLLEVQEDRPIPKQHVIRVTDHRLGWARLENTRIRVKIQPRQFGELRTGQYIKAFIRFRLTGLQAVTNRMAKFDLAAMGFGQNGVDF